MKKTKKEVFINGEDFSFWSSPLTLAERDKAIKDAGSSDTVLYTLQLLIIKAEHEDGTRQYAPGDIAQLKNFVPAFVVTDLLELLQTQNEELEELDMKSSEEGSKARRPSQKSA